MNLALVLHGLATWFAHNDAVFRSRLPANVQITKKTTPPVTVIMGMNCSSAGTITVPSDVLYIHGLHSVL